MVKTPKQDAILDHPWIRNELAGMSDDTVLQDYVSRREKMYLRGAEIGEFKSGYIGSVTDPTDVTEELELYESIIQMRKAQHERRLSP